MLSQINIAVEPTVREWTHKGGDGRTYLTRTVNGQVEYSLPIRYTGHTEKDANGRDRLIIGYEVIR